MVCQCASVISYLKDSNKLKSGLIEGTNEPVIICIRKNEIKLGDEVFYYAFERKYSFRIIQSHFRTKIWCGLLTIKE